jgi:hypothetical protein
MSPDTGTRELALFRPCFHGVRATQGRVSFSGSQGRFLVSLSPCRVVRREWWLRELEIEGGRENSVDEMLLPHLQMCCISTAFSGKEKNLFPAWCFP